jgi:hypothetical protein
MAGRTLALWQIYIYNVLIEFLTIGLDTLCIYSIVATVENCAPTFWLGRFYFWGCLGGSNFRPLSVRSCTVTRKKAIARPLIFSASSTARAVCPPKDLSDRLRALRDLAAGKLRPPVSCPLTRAASPFLRVTLQGAYPRERIPLAAAHSTQEHRKVL